MALINKAASALSVQRTLPKRLMAYEIQREKHRKIAAPHARSLVHGLAMLVLDGQVEYDPELVEQVVLAMAPE